MKDLVGFTRLILYTGPYQLRLDGNGRVFCGLDGGWTTQHAAQT